MRWILNFGYSVSLDPRLTLGDAVALGVGLRPGLALSAVIPQARQ